MRPVSSVYGRIERLLLALPGSSPIISDVAELRRRYQGILATFTPQVEIYILGRYSPGLQQQVDEAFPGCTIRLLEADHKGEHESSTTGLYPYHSYWVQDPFVVLESACGPVFLEPYYYEKREDRWIAEQVSSQTDATIKSTPLDIQGGNILIGDDYALVGPDLIERVVERTGDRKQARDLLARTLGLKKVGSPYLNSKSRIGGPVKKGDTGFQPLYHLDLYITLGGKNKAADEVVFVAELPGWLMQKLDLANLHLHELSQALDETCAWFRQDAPSETGRKWTVYRVPIVPHKSKDILGNPVYFFHSFNNSHMEQYGDVRKAYLPKFHADERQDFDPSSPEHMAQDAYKDAGFHVTWVDNGFAQKATKLGALHCISSILKRKNA